MNDDRDRTGSFAAPPSSRRQSQDDPANLLKQYVNKRDFLPGRALVPGVVGTMDNSIEYPITRRVERTTFVSAAGFNIVQLVTPEPDQHMVVFYSFFQAIGLNPVIETALWTQTDATAGAGLAVGTNAVPLLWAVPITIIGLRRLVPLIATEVSSGANRIQGIRAVYLPVPVTLWVGWDAGLGGQNTLVFTQSLSLPDTQPVSSIMDL